MIGFVEQLTRSDAPATRQQARVASATAKRKAGRPKAFTFTYIPPAKTFNLNLKFRKSEVDRNEIISALTAIIDELKSTE